MSKIVIDPVNRMEGHIGIDSPIAVDPANNGFTVTDANLKGNMFRGYEILLTNRDPRDAMVITQRH